MEPTQELTTTTSSDATAKVELVVEGKPITITVDLDDAPVTADNFLDLVDRGIYDNTIFHRVEKTPEPFVVQGGDPQGKDPEFPIEQLGTGGFIDPDTGEKRNIPLEIKPQGATEPIYSKTFSDAGITVPPALPHTRGAVAMARSSQPDTASSQFYFALSDLPDLDGNYAVFGYVDEGMDIIDSITQGDQIDYAAVVEGVVPTRTSEIVTNRDLINELANIDGQIKVELFTNNRTGEIVSETPSPASETPVDETLLNSSDDNTSSSSSETTTSSSPVEQTDNSSGGSGLPPELQPENIDKLIQAELAKNPQAGNLDLSKLQSPPPTDATANNSNTTTGKRGLQATNEVLAMTTPETETPISMTPTEETATPISMAPTDENAIEIIPISAPVSTTPSNSDDLLDLNSSELSTKKGLMAFQGNDEIIGNDRNNVFNGNQDDDSIYGGSGSDFLRGGKNNDQLFGEAGDDYLVGDFGTDTLTGGLGADVFLLRGEAAQGITDPLLADIITDFNLDEGDKVCLIGNFALTDVQYSLSGSDTVIKLTNGDILGIVKNATTDLVSSTISIVSPNDIIMQIG